MAASTAMPPRTLRDISTCRRRKSIVAGMRRSAYLCGSGERATETQPETAYWTTKKAAARVGGSTTSSTTTYAARRVTTSAASTRW